jgi:ABC-2 type transport system permease protein
MSALGYAVSDTLVLAKRSLLRIRRQPDLLIGYTVQPVMFVLLFVFVFGGAIETPGFDYVDFLMPGIIVQSMAFGGFVTALGLADDLKKGLIDRFRSLPMTRSAVVTGRTLADVAANVVQLVVMIAVGLAVGFSFSTGVLEVIAGIALLLFIGYAFSWVFAFIGLTASSPEASNAYGFTILFPLTFVSSAFVPVESMPGWLQPFRREQPVHDHGRRDPRAVPGHACRKRHLGCGGLGRRRHRGVRNAVGLALPPRGHPLTLTRARGPRPRRAREGGLHAGRRSGSSYPTSRSRD